MANYFKAKNQDGDQTYITSSQGLGPAGYVEESFLAAAVLETAFDNTSGFVLVEDTGIGDSASFAIVNTAGVPTLEQLVTNAAFSLVKDNAGTINVYFEANTLGDLVVKIQNNSAGGDTSLTAKALV